MFRELSFVRAVTVVCVILYLASLMLDPGTVLRPRGFMDILSPSTRALWMVGAAGSVPWHFGAWWTLLTAIYLHAGILHILFNLLWIRQLAPGVEEVYGLARLVVIFTVAGALGFFASNLVGYPFTVGASGSIFGLLGAIVAFGHQRGGYHGRLVFREYGQSALLLFLFGFFMPGVNNVAHLGGFVGGFATALALSITDRREEQGLDRLLALLCVAVTLLGFGLALRTAFFPA